MTDDQTLPARIIALEGGHNFRGVGGLPAAGGRRLREGLIWRSAGLDRLTPADCRLILDLGVRTIADLRGDSERDLHPTASGLLENTRALTWEADSESHAAPPIPWRDLPLEVLRDAFVKAYPRIAANHSRHLAGLIQVIADGGAPVLIHCTAGKDRTGVLVALILDLIGVPRELILRDYELTAVHLRKDLVNLEGVGAVGGQVSWMAGLAPAARDLVLGVDRAWLLAAFADIEDRFGSVEAFARDGLSVSPETLDAFRRVLLEAAPFN